LLRFLVVLFLSVSLQAQEVIELKGKILNDTIEKASLTVVNISIKKGAITNAAGEFTIAARKNDTIHISGVQYESREFVVSETIFHRERISFYLVPKITELDEVRISNIELTGDPKKDVSTTKLAPVITASTLGLPENRLATYTPEQRRLYASTSSPLASLINAISGRTAMLKRHLEVSVLQAKVFRTKDKFSGDLYMKELKIPADLIKDFVYYIYEDEAGLAHINQNNLIELLDYMMIKSKQYLALKQLEN
jgi:hypothetical protein